MLGRGPGGGRAASRRLRRPVSRMVVIIVMGGSLVGVGLLAYLGRHYWETVFAAEGPQAERAFQQPDGKRGRASRDAKDRQIAELEARLARQEAKLVQKNEVISELMEENVRAKKANGEL